jgi:hypothetical protein
MWLLVVLVVAGIVGVAIQHYAMKKMRSGFSLRGDGEPRPRRSLFADPEEEATRRWLEGEEEDEPEQPDESEEKNI